MYKVFPCPDYYQSSVAISDIQGLNPIAERSAFQLRQSPFRIDKNMAYCVLGYDFRHFLLIAVGRLRVLVISRLA